MWNLKKNKNCAALRHNHMENLQNCVVFKKDENNEIENQNLIVILINIVKLLKFVLYEVVLTHLKGKIIPQQNEFFDRISTTTILVTHLDCGNQVNVIYTVEIVPGFQGS